VVVIIFYATGFSGTTPRGLKLAILFFYIKRVLAILLAIYNKERPIMSSLDWFLERDNTPGHTVDSVP
jgi:hypothetical protein